MTDLGMSDIQPRCRHGEPEEECRSCNKEKEDIEAFTHGFERVDFYRLAFAFQMSIEEVHTAVGKVGMLYRRRA